MECAFVTNVKLLDFADFLAKENTRVSVPLHSAMFDTTNQKGFETLLYFLLIRLDESHYRGIFRAWWPVIDRKTGMEYRKALHHELNLLATAHNNPKLTCIPSVMLSSSGPHVYSLLDNVSTFVLIKRMTSAAGSRGPERLIQCPNLKDPLLMKTGFKGLEALLSGAVVSRAQSFYSRLPCQEAAEKAWCGRAQESLQENRRLSRAIEEIEGELRRRLGLKGKVDPLNFCQDPGFPGTPSSLSSGFLPTSEEQKRLERTDRIGHVRNKWKMIDSALNKKEALCEAEVIAHVLKAQPSETNEVDREQDTIQKEKRLTLSASRDLPIHVPEILLRHHAEELYQADVVNQLHRGGEVRLDALIRLLNLSLTTYLSEAKQAFAQSSQPQPMSVSDAVQSTASSLQQSAQRCSELAAATSTTVEQLSALLDTMRAELEE